MSQDQEPVVGPPESVPSGDISTQYSGSTDEGKAGDLVGRYVLRHKIGEGGCGVVYLAEQENPARRVAIKVIKPGMDTREVVARFQTERQALALMDHPNIAKVYDAGSTEKGRPYFVMELVSGVPITKYCDDCKLSTATRLGLFMQVCTAVQHAHQKGIIHRDIKPSNILVTLVDGKPVPKVIDFGIAKATNGRLTDLTVFTAIEQFIGTPAYMSPEQAQLSSLDIDTRSDIYSLGVLLYELLTGRTPFESSELLKAGLDEMRRNIREVEPPRPSVRLGTIQGEAGTVTGQQRQIELPKLIQLVRGDLDWIVMRCLEKDRTRRYESASGLARDLQCYLVNEPVSARPPSKSYLFQKLVRRHRLAFAAGAAIVVLLVAGITVSAWLAQKARKEALLASDTLRFLVEDLLGAGGAVQQGTDIKDLTMLQALDLAEARISSRFQDRPLVELGVREAFLNAYVYLEKWERAITQCERMLSLRKMMLGPDQRDTLYNMQFLARCYRKAGRYEDSIRLFEATVGREKTILGPDDPDTLLSMAHLGLAYLNAGQLSNSIPLYQEIVERRKARLGPNHSETLDSVSWLATTYRNIGRLSEAIPLFEDTLQRRRATLGPDHVDTLANMKALVSAYGDAKDFTKANLIYRELLELRSKKDGPDSLVVAGDSASFGQNLLAQGRYVEAERILRKAMAVFVSKAPKNWEAYEIFSLLGETLTRLKQFDEAEPLLISGYEGMKTLASTRGGSGPRHLKESLDRLVQYYEAIGRQEQAAKWQLELKTLAASWH